MNNINNIFRSKQRRLNNLATQLKEEPIKALTEVKEKKRKKRKMFKDRSMNM